MTTQSDAPSLVTKRSRFTVLGPPDGLGLTLNVVHRLLVPPQWSSRPSDCVVVPKREGPVRLGMSLRVEGEPVDEETVMKSPIPAMLEDALHLVISELVGAVTSVDVFRVAEPTSARPFARLPVRLLLLSSVLLSQPTCQAEWATVNLFPSPSDALHDDASVQPVAELDSIHLTFCFTAAEPTPSRAPSPLESLLLGPDPGPGSEQVLERLVGTLDPATVDTVRQGIATVLQRQMGKRWPLMFNPSYRDVSLAASLPNLSSHSADRASRATESITRASQSLWSASCRPSTPARTTRTTTFFCAFDKLVAWVPIPLSLRPGLTTRRRSWSRARPARSSLGWATTATTTTTFGTL